MNQDPEADCRATVRNRVTAMSAPNWNVEQPAVIFLREEITALFPEVAFHWAAEFNTDPANVHKERVNEHHRLHGVGGLKKRLKRFGTAKSEHWYGRAADIYLHVRNPLLKCIGDNIFAVFVANGVKLGMDEIIWNRQIWSIHVPTIHPYAQKEHHEDHVHVGFSSSGSQRKPRLLHDVLVSARTAVDAQFPCP